MMITNTYEYRKFIIYQDLLEIHQNFDDKKYQIYQDQKYKMTRMQRIYKIKIYDTKFMMIMNLWIQTHTTQRKYERKDIDNILADSIRILR